MDFDAAVSEGIAPAPLKLHLYKYRVELLTGNGAHSETAVSAFITFCDAGDENPARNAALKLRATSESVGSRGAISSRLVIDNTGCRCCKSRSALFFLTSKAALLAVKTLNWSLLSGAALYQYTAGGVELRYRSAMWRLAGIRAVPHDWLQRANC